MIEDFIKSYSAVLYERGYNISDLSNINNDSPENYTILYKLEGPIGYITMLINLDKLTPEQAQQLVHGYTEYTKNKFENLNAKNVFIVYQLISETEQEISKQILELSEPYDNQQVYPIFWEYPLDSKKLNFNKNQPNEVGGLAAALKETEKNPSPVIKQRTSYPVILTYALIVINSIIYILLRMAGSMENPGVLLAAGALVPEYVFYNHEFYRLLNPIFLHFDTMHLAANCLSLYIFGTITEKYFSKLSYLAIYFVSGIAGNILSLFTVSGMSVGASGAVYGLMGAALVVSHVAPRAVTFLNTYHIAIMSIMGIGIGFVVTNVNNAAHIGGMAVGAAVAYLLHILSQRQPEN